MNKHDGYLVNVANGHLEAADAMPAYDDDPEAHRVEFFASASRNHFLEAIDYLLPASIDPLQSAILAKMNRLELAAVTGLMLEVAAAAMQPGEFNALFEDMCECIGWAIR